MFRKYNIEEINKIEIEHDDKSVAINGKIIIKNVSDKEFNEAITWANDIIKIKPSIELWETFESEYK